MVALTALLFWGLMVSRLYTRSQHESIVSLYKTEADKKDKLIEQLTAQNTVLIEGTRTAKDFFDKVPVSDRTDEVPVQHARGRKAASP